MRANLLPQERRQIGVFGASLDFEFAKRAVALTALGSILFTVTAGVQWLRAETYRRAATKIESELELHDRLRQRVATLARQVALLQRIDQASQAAKYSGNQVAVDIVRIGNSIPRGVWLDSLGRGGDGYFLSGGAHGLDALADTLRSLGASSPRFPAALIRLDQPQAVDTLRFTLRIPTEESVR
jgi:Tfp pilus assembly protein PilN